MIAGLVNHGLTTLTHEKVRADGELIDVSKVRIRVQYAANEGRRIAQPIDQVRLDAMAVRPRSPTKSSPAKPIMSSP